MHADLIARSRTGDRTAFAGLVNLWADQALLVALQAARDPEDAGDAVARAFVRAYAELPTQHRSVGFRTWLMMLVLEGCGAPPRDARLRAVLDQKGPTGARRADRALSGLLGETPRLRLSSSFYEERIEPELVEPAEAFTTRHPEVPDLAWLIGTTVAVLAEASGMTMRAVTRTGATGRGACSKPTPSHDVLEVTHRSTRHVGWTVRSSARILPGEVEASYDASLTPSGLTLRLRGIAIPRGLSGRIGATMAASSRDRRHDAVVRAWDHALGGSAPAGRS